MSEKVQIYWCFFMLVLGLLPVETQAQQLSRLERKQIAERAINDLKGGVLILRLKSKRNKITKLEELIASPKVKEVDKKKLRKELERTIDNQNRENLTLTEAFEKYYTFSDIYYMYDTASVSLKNGVKSGIFLNKNLELDESISIPKGEFFIIRTGTTDSGSTTGVDAMVIMDSKLKDMNRPFPYYVRVNSIGRLFVRIFNHKKLIKKDSRDVVKKLDANLHRYEENVFLKNRKQ